MALPIISLGRASPGAPSFQTFELGLLIEKSVAFHGYDSSFMWAAELMNYGCPKYVHNYVRAKAFPNEPWRRYYARQLRGKWIVVE